MFDFLKGKHMVFDTTDPDIDPSTFPREDWLETAFGKCKEELPPNAPQDRRIGMTIRDFFDSDHTGNTIN